MVELLETVSGEGGGNCSIGRSTLFLLNWRRWDEGHAGLRGPGDGVDALRDIMVPLPCVAVHVHRCRLTFPRLEKGGLQLKRGGIWDRELHLEVRRARASIHYVMAAESGERCSPPDGFSLAYYKVH
jgi:hypothetical protein